MSTEKVNPSSLKRRENSSQSSNSLGCYLSDVGKIEMPDSSLRLELWQEIDAKELQLQNILNLLGFTGLEIIRILDECLQSGSDPLDFFLYSSLCHNKELPVELAALMKQWREEIAAAHAALQKAFDSGKDTSKERSKLAACLKKYRLNNEMVSGLCETALGYCRLQNQKSNFINSRFLMNNSEISSVIEDLKKVRDELDSLQRKVAEANLRLVISIANRYRDCSVPVNDIIQEGNLGLMLAIQRFDFNLGNKFSTYAGWWIRHYILRAIAEQSRVIRLPLHMIQAIQNMNRTEQRLIQTTGREPDIQELANALEMPLARVSALRKMALQTLSLQAPVSTTENETALEDIFVPDENNEPWRNYAQKILYAKLYEMLNTLPERERLIIVYRFGLCGEPPLSLIQISSKLNLSRERVRQLENKVMEQLRSKEYLKFIDGLSHLDN